MGFVNFITNNWIVLVGALAFIYILFWVYKKFEKVKCSKCGNTIPKTEMKYRCSFSECDKKKYCENCASSWIKEPKDDDCSFFAYCCKKHQELANKENKDDEDEEEDESSDEENQIKYFEDKKYAVLNGEDFDSWKPFFKQTEELESKGYKHFMSEETRHVFRKEEK